MKHFAVIVLALAIIVSSVIIGLSSARADNALYANWGCPTVDGPLDIARAYELGNDAIAIGNAHDCIKFPMSLVIEPVRFVKEVNEGDGGTAFVWEVRFPGDVDTFFTNYNAKGNAILMQKLGSL